MKGSKNLSLRETADTVKRVSAPPAFPEILAPSSVNAVAQQRITDAVEHFFTPTSFSAQGAVMMIEESARECALGNPAACH